MLSAKLGEDIARSATESAESVGSGIGGLFATWSWPAANVVMIATMFAAAIVLVGLAALCGSLADLRDR